jgi:hypothetical protein
MKDGRRVICFRANRLVAVDVNSGRTTELLVTSPPLGGGARLAADDSQLFFLRGTTSADIWVARFGQPGRPQ